MTRTAVACTALLVVTMSVAQAQSIADYELAQRNAETERMAMVAANMPLQDSEADRFWDLYRQYRAAAGELDDARASLLRRYERSIDDLSDEEGRQIVANALRVETDRQSLKKLYTNRFAEILQGQRLFRFYQIETKLDAIQRYDWTQWVPLAPVPE